MRYSPYKLFTMIAALIASSAFAWGQTSVAEAVVMYDNLMREYNVVTSGNLTLNGVHVHGGVAVGGNLNITGNSSTINSDQLTTSLPAVYVAGNINLTSSAQLLKGSVYAPNYSNTTTWYNPNNANQKGLKSKSNSSNKLILDDTTSTKSALTTTPVDAEGWTLSSTLSSLASVSSYLASAEANGTVTYNSSSRNLVFSTTATSGVVVFYLDASLYNFSGGNIQISVPTDVVYVINVINADGTNLFSGANFNSGTNNDQLLWNIVPDSNPCTDSTVNIGSNNFYGSILAPLMTVTNNNGSGMYGQIMAANYSQTGNQIHSTNDGVDFDASFITFSAVPEPAAWGPMAIVAALVGAGLRRPRRVKPSEKQTA